LAHFQPLNLLFSHIKSFWIGMGYSAGGRSGLKGLGWRELYLDKGCYTGGV